MKRLEEVGLSIPQLVAAVIFVVYGIGSYYVVPLAFLFNTMDLLMLLLNILFLSLIFGMIFLGLLAQPFLESLALKAL